jgi:SH3-like domain-containing protein
MLSFAWSRGVLALLALTLAAQPLSPGVLAAPQSAYRAASPEYGMSVFVYGNPATTQRDLAKLQAVEFGWQKSLFSWREIEGACKGCFRWDEADRVVRASSEAGIKIVARLDFQPAWSRKDGAHNGPPDKYEDYADFVRAFVERYRQGSSVGRVHAIEIWNEPNLSREWGNKPINRQRAADYVRLLSLSYAAAKSADPNVTVITAGLSPNGASADYAQPDDVYLRWMYESGLRGHYDVLGAHANAQCPCVDATPGSLSAFNHPSFYFRRVEQLRDIMVANGDVDKQIWLLEFGWTTDRVNPSYAWYATTEDRKADLIVQAFQFAHEHWTPWIGVMVLWTIAAPGWGQNDEQTWWAVTNPNGTDRPAYQRLVRARSAGELPLLASPPIAPPLPLPGSDSVTLLRVVGTGGATLHLRELPGTSFESLKDLEPGTTLQAVGGFERSDGLDWREVRDAVGATGWVAADFVVEATGLEAAEAPTPGGDPVRVAIEDGYLNLREGPSLSAAIVQPLLPDLPLVKFGEDTDADGRTWFRVHDPEGTEGWVAAEFVI